MRPILMTTLSSVLGLVPLAVGFGDGAEVRAPLAITLIGGLTLATVLTLVVIPVVYAAFEPKRAPSAGRA
jgi:HAE1 family hydrophobic/amphiphilic exporter-1